MLFVPHKLAPKERSDLNLFNKSLFDSVWVECRSDFSQSCSTKMLINLSYNPHKKYSKEFLGDLDINLDQSFSQSSSIILMGDYNIDYLDNQERGNLENVIAPYGLLVSSPESPTRITERSQSHIDYIIHEQVTNCNSFVFDTRKQTLEKG